MSVPAAISRYGIHMYGAKSASGHPRSAQQASGEAIRMEIRNEYGNTAGNINNGGITPWLFENVDFQAMLLSMQLFREKAYADISAKLPDDKVLIVCDRGALDNKAYMNDDDFQQILDALGTNEVDLRDHYDAVFHLVSAADGAEEFYTTANNEARTETVEQAYALDRALISAWTGHPYLRVIDNSTGFEEKIMRVTQEISHFLGEPQPFEIERKFLIEYPDTVMLESLPNCQKVDIIQTYLLSQDPESELRIRQRGCDGNYIYIKTEKRKVSEMKRVEVERRLSRSEYLSLLMSADTSLRQIRKTRYCLSWGRQYFEIDIYPFWDTQAILEIELIEESKEITFPDFLTEIREVTEDESYKNHSLARVVPSESHGR